MTPADRQRLCASARARALSRLRQRHPDEFRELYEQELAEGPIYGRLAGVSFQRRYGRVTPDVVEQVRRLAAAGNPDHVIAQRLGRCRTTVAGIRYEHNIPPACRGRPPKAGAR